MLKVKGTVTLMIACVLFCFYSRTHIESFDREHLSTCAASVQCCCCSACTDCFFCCVCCCVLSYLSIWQTCDYRFDRSSRKRQKEHIVAEEAMRKQQQATRDLIISNMQAFNSDEEVRKQGKTDQYNANRRLTSLWWGWDWVRGWVREWGWDWVRGWVRGWGWDWVRGWVRGWGWEWVRGWVRGWGWVASLMNGLAKYA